MWCLQGGVRVWGHAFIICSAAVVLRQGIRSTRRRGFRIGSITGWERMERCRIWVRICMSWWLDCMRMRRGLLTSSTDTILESTLISHQISDLISNSSSPSSAPFTSKASPTKPANSSVSSWAPAKNPSISPTDSGSSSSPWCSTPPSRNSTTPV